MFFNEILDCKLCMNNIFKKLKNRGKLTVRKSDSQKWLNTYFDFSIQL